MRIQIFMIKKCLKQALFVFLKRQYYLILFLKNYENYYPQVYLKVCKSKKKKLSRYITDDLEISSDDSDKED